MIVSLATIIPQATIGAGTDTLVGFKNLTGSAFDDVLTGSLRPNTLNGLDGNDQLSGGSGNDILIGGNGDDTVMGGAGIDTLTGGAGADVFALGAAFAANADTITDFEHGVDKLRISSAVLPAGTLSPSNLVFGTAATDPHAEFVYNAAAHTLSWDPDGTGLTPIVAVVIFNTAVTLTASDFVIV